MSAEGSDGAASFEELARRYRSPLVRYFQRGGANATIAEDMAHEVFMRVSRRGITGIGNPEAYIFATAASVRVDFARRSESRHERQHEPIDDLDLPSGEPSLSRVFEDREALLRLAAIVDELPQRTREIFLLNRLDRLTNTQLAARYGISVSASLHSCGFRDRSRTSPTLKLPIGILREFRQRPSRPAAWRQCSLHASALDLSSNAIGQ